MSFPSTPEIIEAIPIIVSLIVIEGLLSIDNALAIAALASHLPGKQKYQALKFGIIGAYLFRGAALGFAAFIIANQWIRLVGAAYLLYLMGKNLSADEGEDVGQHGASPTSFVMTIVQIELLDLSLSIDNVVAAVALSPKMWVVITGVFIGILALRFLAGYCIRLLEIFPILGKTAFLLVGYVGTILVAEEVGRMAGRNIHIDSTGKFVGIVLIVVATLLYSRFEFVRRIAWPFVTTGRPVMRLLAATGDSLAWPFKRIAKAARANRSIT